MKHNTISLQILLVIALTLLATPVLAQEFTEGDASTVAVSEITTRTSVDAGLTATSPFYFIDRLGEEVDILFTFDEERKIEKYEMIADERLAELRVLSQAGYITEAEKTAELYVRHYNTVTRLALSDQVSFDDQTKLKIQSRLAQGAVMSLQDLETLKKILPELTYSADILKGVVTTNQIALVDSIANYDPTRAELYLVTALATSTEDIVRATEMLKQEGGSVATLDSAIQNYNTYSTAGKDLLQENTMSTLESAMTSTSGVIRDAITGVRTTTIVDEDMKYESHSAVTTTNPLQTSQTGETRGEGTILSGSNQNQVYSDGAGETWQSWYIRSRGTVGSFQKKD